MKQKFFFIIALAMLLGATTIYAQDGFEVYRLMQLKSKKTKNKWVANPWVGKQHQYKVIYHDDEEGVLYCSNFFIDYALEGHGIHFVSNVDSIAKDVNDTGGVRNFSFEGNRMRMEWYSSNKYHVYFPENDWVTEEFERVNLGDLRPEELMIIDQISFFRSGHENQDTLGIQDVWYRSGFAWTDNKSGSTKTTVVPDGRNQNYYKVYGKDFMMTFVTAKTPVGECFNCKAYSKVEGWLGPVEYLGNDLTREWYRRLPVIHYWINKDTIHSVWVDMDAWKKQGDTIREVWERVK